MSGSSFGKAFNITTFGESHGKAIGVVIQGCPPGLVIDEDIIQKALDKRKPGDGVSSTKRREPDHPIILSGTFNGQTTGTPIMILIENKTQNQNPMILLPLFSDPAMAILPIRPNMASEITGEEEEPLQGRQLQGWQQVQWRNWYLIGKTSK